MQAQGGFLPAIDDLLMPDMRLEDIRYCIDLIRKHIPRAKPEPGELRNR